MASVEEALVTMFKNEPTITALLGTPLRYTPDVIPQGTAMPAAAYQRISNTRQDSLLTIGTLTRQRLQITIWANNAASRNDVRIAIIGFLRTANIQWRNGVRARALNGVRFGGILIDNDIEQKEPASAIFQSLVDLIIWYNVDSA